MRLATKFLVQFRGLSGFRDVGFFGISLKVIHTYVEWLICVLYANYYA